MSDLPENYPKKPIYGQFDVNFRSICGKMNSKLYISPKEPDYGATFVYLFSLMTKKYVDFTLKWSRIANLWLI